MQNMARSSNKQSTSAPPADTVARSPHATVVQKQPRVILSPKSRASFERRVAQHQANVAAVNAHLAKEKAAKDATAAAKTQPATDAAVPTIATAPSESSDAVGEKSSDAIGEKSSDAVGEKSTATKKKGKGKGTKEPKAANEPKAASGGKKKTKKNINSGKEKII
jgi:hypothetical protein